MFPNHSNILLIDDSQAILALVKIQLEQLGFHNIWEAENGEAAYEVLNELEKKGKVANLIISDWKMPIMDGLTFLRKVKKEARFKATPFLMIAAEREIENVLEAISEGVSDYIVKPFEKEALSQKLKAIWLKSQP